MQHATRAPETCQQVARTLMEDFLDRTGVTAAVEPQRYLWTDAFAVCNLIALADRQSASALVEQVHAVLGRHRPDDERTGWISGLDDAQGARHPTIGGLRIGKPLPERRPGALLDPQLEWDRDGQYFHYLIKWMHALNRMTLFTGSAQYNTWAIELARTAVARFSHRGVPAAHRRLYWKMSVDLSRPLVPSMGQHDPLEGLITCGRLAATTGDGRELHAEMSTLGKICKDARWLTDDPLGIGGLLTDACELAQLIVDDAFTGTELLESVLEAAAHGLHVYTGRADLRLSSEQRLAFRELGLVIGLLALDRLENLAEADARLRSTAIDELASLAPIGEVILDFWMNPLHRQCSTWREHRNINDVMLATCLLPDGFLAT